MYDVVLALIKLVLPCLAFLILVMSMGFAIERFMHEEDEE
mgnify:CR=1 FL=1